MFADDAPYITQTPMNFLPWQMIALKNYQNGLLLINYIFILIRLVVIYLVPNIKNLDKFKLYICGKGIKHVTYCKYLGILIDTDLKWQEHINYIYNKLIKYSNIFFL